jgi:hypothetical protein
MNRFSQFPAANAVDKDHSSLTSPYCAVEFTAEPCHLPVERLDAAMPPAQVKINLSHLFSDLVTGLLHELKSVLKNSYFCRPEHQVEENRPMGIQSDPGFPDQ